MEYVELVLLYRKVMGVKGLGLSCELMTRYHLKHTSIIGILAYMHVAIVTSDQYIMTE